jgi:AraC-like DNA-binding protein
MIRDRTHRDRTASQYDPKIAQALSYINDHLGEELTVDGLAQQVYTSKYHFMRRFKELTGYPVHQYITQKRLLAAAELLRGGASAQAACGRCGFRDYSAFHRAFRRQFGVTPRALMP